MPAPYSYDFRSKAISAVKRGERKIDVCHFFGISRNTLDLWLKREAETGDFAPKLAERKGRELKIQDLEKFREFARDNGERTQKQMAELWGEGITQQNVSDALKKLGITRKKKTYGYRERDEEKRREFLAKLARVDPKDLVFVDEAGMDNREDYPYGYCERGERFHAFKSGKRTERVSWLAALREKQLFAPLTFVGGCNRDLFEAWLERCLLPQLKPGQVIIIDNATFHHSQYIRELVAEAGCEIWYLPPYSPDLNKIERWWFILKNWMKQRLKDFDNFRDCVDAAFRECPNVSA